MNSSQKLLCIISICLFNESQSLFLQKIKTAVKDTKCKLHTIGNSIIGHNHKHGDPCEVEEVHNVNIYGIGVDQTYSDPSKNQVDSGTQTIDENIPHNQYQHYNGHSYGGDDIQQGRNQNSSDYYPNQSNNNNQYVPERSSEKLSAKENTGSGGPNAIDQSFERQEKDKGLLTDQDQQFQMMSNNTSVNLDVDLNNHTNYLQNNEEGSTTKPESSTDSFNQYQKHHNPISNEDDLSNSSIEDGNSSVPKIDIRSGMEKPNTTYIAVPREGGKGIISAKCNEGVMIKGDTTCRSGV